jgi:hypothetical protein
MWFRSLNLLLRAGGSAGLRGPLVASARAPALLGLAPFIAPPALRSPHIRLCAFRWRAGSLAAHRAGCLARSASASRSLWYVGPYCCAASSFRIMCVCEEPALFNKHCLVACLCALSDASAAALCLVRPGVVFWSSAPRARPRRGARQAPGIPRKLERGILDPNNTPTNSLPIKDKGK